MWGRLGVVRFASQLRYVATFTPISAAASACPACRDHRRSRKNDPRGAPTQIARYLAKISGPLLDRIDLQVEVPALSGEEIASTLPGEASSAIRDRVKAARQIQRERFRRSHADCNAEMNTRQMRKFCELGPSSRRLLEHAVSRLGLSARGYDRVLKVARTIADLAGSERIDSSHVAESVHYRALDRAYFRTG